MFEKHNVLLLPAYARGASGRNKRNRRLLDPCRIGVIRHNKAQLDPAIRYISSSVVFRQMT